MTWRGKPQQRQSRSFAIVDSFRRRFGEYLRQFGSHPGNPGSNDFEIGSSQPWGINMPRGLGAGGAFVLLLAGQIASAETQTEDICTAKKDKTVTIINNQSAPATVFINFGAESAIN